MEDEPMLRKHREQGSKRYRMLSERPVETEEFAYDDLPRFGDLVVAEGLQEEIGVYVAEVMVGPKPSGFAVFVARHDDGPLGLYLLKSSGKPKEPPAAVFSNGADATHKARKVRAG
jgi:hypothetical protein